MTSRRPAPSSTATPSSLRPRRSRSPPTTATRRPPTARCRLTSPGSTATACWTARSARKRRGGRRWCEPPWRARTSSTPPAPPGAWLRRIGVNLAISHRRRQKLARFLPARLYVAPDRRDYDRAEARDVVEKAMAELSPKLRAAVVLHYYEGLTREEIADVLGVPAGTVASRIAKAVAIMRKMMGSDQTGKTERSSSEGALRGR